MAQIWVVIECYRFMLPTYQIMGKESKTVLSIGDEKIKLVVLKNEIVAVVTCKVSGSLTRHLAYVLPSFGCPKKSSQKVF